jgi:hypothetical protein
MNKIQLTPTQASYSVEYGQTTVGTSFQSGRRRYRRDVINPNHTISVRWIVDPLGLQYLRSFFNTTLKGGSLPFLIDLIIDGGNLTEHEAHFIEDSLQVGEVNGNLSFVTAQLEAVPLPVDDEANDSLVMLYEEYGISTIEVLDLLEKLVNIDFPEAIPNE